MHDEQVRDLLQNNVTPTNKFPVLQIATFDFDCITQIFTQKQGDMGAYCRKQSLDETRQGTAEHGRPLVHAAQVTV